MLFSPTSLGNGMMTVISFLILMYIVYHFAYKPVEKVINDRRDKIQDELESAEAAKNEGIQMTREADEILTEARVQGTQIIKDAKKQATLQSQQAIADTQEEIQQLREKAKRQLEQERLQMIEKLESDTIKYAVVLASKIVKHDVTPEDHQEIIESFISGLEAHAHE